MNIVLLIICCLSIVFAFSFLMAAVFTFVTCDQKPLDRNTDKLLSLSVWFGGGMLIYVFAITRYWRHSQLGRRLFYTGSAFGVVAVACGFLPLTGLEYIPRRLAWPRAPANGHRQSVFSVFLL